MRNGSEKKKERKEGREGGKWETGREGGVRDGICPPVLRDTSNNNPSTMIKGSG